MLFHALPCTTSQLEVVVSPHSAWTHCNFSFLLSQFLATVGFSSHSPGCLIRLELVGLTYLTLSPLIKKFLAHLTSFFSILAILFQTYVRAAFKCCAIRYCAPALGQGAPFFGFSPNFAHLLTSSLLITRFVRALVKLHALNPWENC